MSNPYIDLCLHLQALRRQSEELRTPLASALGVAGSVYTHQVANVLRVLTDIRVRHLLADEVGLGKTVQALMVLNALRRQRPDLRALVIVPDRLVPQWRDELLTRAHTTPYDQDVAEDGQYVRLAWERLLREKDDATGAPKFELSSIDPSRFEILIVDEMHDLNTDLQNKIARVSADFEHLLVLTATPSFQSPKEHAQLFALLEPERTALARSDVAGESDDLKVADELSKWPVPAAQRVIDWFLERDRKGAASADTDSLTATAVANCAYRRVIRTRRIDYPGVLPRRQHFPVVVEPLGAEADRQALMWRYFAHLDDLSLEVDSVRLAKRVILSPPSLEQRVDFLRRKGHDRDGLLEQVKPLVHKSRGDSRADALIDLLAAVWSRDPDERVLVAAQDDLTVDYLLALVQARLPEIGPTDARVPLVAVQLRQGMETTAVEGLDGWHKRKDRETKDKGKKDKGKKDKEDGERTYNETQKTIESFQRGEAQILFAPDDTAQVGLNLQCARVLVLYSVPWRPQEVEQWIGRLDRIGNVAAFTNEGAARTIDVYTIVQRGLVDEKVVTVLQRFHVFERSVNQDGAHLGEVTQAIEDAALRPDAVNWTTLEERTASLAAEDAVQELSSALRPHLPWTARWATSQRERIDAMLPIAPVIGAPPKHSVAASKHPVAGPKAWDRALVPMLDLLDKALEYNFRTNTDPETRMRFRTLWYRFGPPVFGRTVPTAKVVFTFGANPNQDRSPEHAFAYITHRGDIGTPARREVTLSLDTDDFRRPLHFMNFGDRLHDELIDGWALQQPNPPAVDASYFGEHELWNHAQPGWFLVRLSLLDPAEALSSRSTLEALERSLARVVTKSPDEHLPRLLSPFSRAARCALEADSRWLRASLPAMTSLVVHWKPVEGEWRRLSDEGAVALMNPMAHRGNGLPAGKPIYQPDPTLNREVERVRGADGSGREVWNGEWSTFVADLNSRLFVVAEEARDAVSLAAREVERAEQALADARQRGNRPQITRLQNLLSGARDSAAMTEVYWQHRQGWLRDCVAAVASLRPQERLVAAIRARRPAS